MSLLDKLFPKKHAIVSREMPSWEEIVSHMQGQELSFFTDTIVRVIPSKDRAQRIILLQSNHGFYKIVFEEIRVWEEEEWNCCGDSSRYPAWWEPVDAPFSRSIYGTQEEAIHGVMESHEYKAYFA